MSKRRNAGGKKLTQKQEAFCLAYLETGNASEAYRRSYNAERMSPPTIWRKACELMSNGKVKARIAELTAKATTAAVMTRQEALERLSTVARTDLADLVEFSEYTLGEDGEGKPIIQAAWRVKDSVMQDRAKLAAIAELTAGRDGIRVKTHNPIQAIQQLAKMQGWESATKHEHSGPGGGPVQTVNFTAEDYRRAEAELSSKLEGLD